MPPHAQRVTWMSSSPFAFDARAIDLAHLERMTMGDAALAREVLAMFVSQSARLLGMLETLPAEARALAHTLKGSARAIGAARVAECAQALEIAIGEGEDLRPSLRQLSAAVAEARVGIEAMLRRA
jgi:HPt (histidine-containing phosphotransfer) domain-containing protein